MLNKNCCMPGKTKIYLIKGSTNSLSEWVYEYQIIQTEFLDYLNLYAPLLMDTQRVYVLHID